MWIKKSLKTIEIPQITKPGSQLYLLYVIKKGLQNLMLLYKIKNVILFSKKYIKIGQYGLNLSLYSEYKEAVNLQKPNGTKLRANQSFSFKSFTCKCIEAKEPAKLFY